MSHLVIFFSNPLPPVSFTKKWRTMAWDRGRFFSIFGCSSISHIKGCRNHIISKDVKKVRKCSYKLCVHSLLHTDTQVLTSHVDKIVDLLFFGCDSITPGTDNILDDFTVAHCNITRAYQRYNKERKLSRKQNGHRKILSEWHHFFGCTPSPLCHFFHFFRELPSPHFLSDVLFDRPLRSAFRTLSNI